MTRISGIYRITNTVNGKAYIGRSVDVHARWSQHRSAALKGRPFPIYNALRKYGADAFVFEVLETCDPLQLRERELAAIDAHGTWADEHGYNVGGTNSGAPSLAEIELMPSDVGAAWKARMAAIGRVGREALKNLRKDSAYEGRFLAIRSAASFTREARIRARMENDAEYRKKISDSKRSAASHRTNGYQASVGAACRARFATDAEYAERVSRNRKRANAASVEVRRLRTQPLIDRAVALRQSGALLKDIASALGKSVPWVCVVTKGSAHAALS